MDLARRTALFQIKFQKTFQVVVILYLRNVTQEAPYDHIEEQVSSFDLRLVQ